MTTLPKPSTGDGSLYQGLCSPNDVTVEDQLAMTSLSKPSTGDGSLYQGLCSPNDVTVEDQLALVGWIFHTYISSSSSITYIK